MMEGRKMDTERNGIVQRTLDWYRSRLGYFTGSQIGKLMGKPRGGGIFSATAMGYIYQVAAERQLNPEIVNDDDLFSEYLDQSSTDTKAMRLGTEKEADARDLFGKKFDVTVEEVGSVECPVLANFAASPDGVFSIGGAPATLEIKCPTLSVYQKFRTEVRDAAALKAVNPDYYWQVMAEVMCVQASGAWICFYNPFHSRPLHCVRLESDERAFEEIRQRVTAAEEMINNNF